jgi:hypothetical protein
MNDIKKNLLGLAEKALSVVLSVSSCMGMFLIGCFAGNLIFGTVSTDAMWAIFLGSVILTYGATQLLLNVRYMRLEILADELELQKDEEARKLCEHLEVK